MTSTRLKTSFKRAIKKCLDDELHIKRQYQKSFGRPIDFLSPTTFNEKIQFQKLYNRDARMTLLADKYLVRDYIERLGHGSILNNLLGVYTSAEEINFEELPDSFVIKCNHSWATNIIVPDKSQLNQREARKSLNSWLKHNHYEKLKEWAYKDIQPRIIIESHLGDDLRDYKFFCFSGVPHFVQIDSERFSNHTLDIYDMDWRRLDCRKGGKANSPAPHARPGDLDEMASIAKSISSIFNFCRVDFLATPDKFYFGEVTFYPGGGFSRFEPESYDTLFGEPFDLNGIGVPATSRLKIKAVNTLGSVGIL